MLDIVPLKLTYCEKKFKAKLTEKRVQYDV
jgi:hypothetical protein